MKGHRKTLIAVLSLILLAILVGSGSVPGEAFVPGLWAILGTTVAGNAGEHFAERGQSDGSS